MDQSKKIFITGSSGFIGRNLAEGFFGKYQVFSPSHKELDLLDDKAVLEFLSKTQFDVVIHAAAVGVGGERAEKEILEMNKQMFLNFYNNRRLFGKMIFLGSGAEYDKTKDIADIKEEQFGESVPKDAYGRAKYFCSELIEQADNIINLRCFGVFGRYEDYKRRFISNILCRLILEVPVVVKQNAEFDFLYVNDLVKIVEYFLHNEPRYKFYNTGSGKKTSLLEIISVIKKVTGKDFEFEILKPGMNREYTCNNERLISQLGGFKFISLEDSIGYMYEWYIKNKINLKL